MKLDAGNIAALVAAGATGFGVLLSWWQSIGRSREYTRLGQLLDMRAKIPDELPASVRDGLDAEIVFLSCRIAPAPKPRTVESAIEGEPAAVRDSREIELLVQANRARTRNERRFTFAGVAGAALIGAGAYFMTGGDVGFWVAVVMWSAALGLLATFVARALYRWSVDGF